MAERRDDPHRLPRARRGRGGDDGPARERPRRGRGAAHLRAAALLRGAPARPLVRRGARHHGPDLRHLPRRLPDERVNALESLCGVEVPEPIRLLRRLLYCGEWIESHALHVYMLHAPDFLGYDGAVELARDAPARWSAASR